MNKSGLIKRAGALFLIIVLALGITPKKTIHSLLANHKDQVSKSTGTQQHLTRGGINCKCDDLVAEGHFLPARTLSFIQPVFTYPAYKLLNARVFDAKAVSPKLRGPPAFSRAS